MKEKNSNVIIGFLLSMLCGALGMFIFLSIIATGDVLEQYYFLKAQNQLGKIIALGAILNLALFFGLLQLKKDKMARGVIFGTIVLALLTQIL
ncbi:MAG: hypothetical protein KBS98_00015 [Flavobacterium sp.]|nr:hypothetical protein [Candidatus Neoflavobacterium equi]